MDEFLQRFSRPIIIKKLLIDAWIGLSGPFRIQAPEALHHQAKNLDEMHARVLQEVENRLERRWYESDLWNDLLTLYGLLDTPECQTVFEYISQNYKEHIEQTVPNTPRVLVGEATEKQINYLRKLGVKDFKGSKQEASELIDSLVKKAA